MGSSGAESGSGSGSGCPSGLGGSAPAQPAAEVVPRDPQALRLRGLLPLPGPPPPPPHDPMRHAGLHRTGDGQVLSREEGWVGTSRLPRRRWTRKGASSLPVRRPLRRHLGPGNSYLRDGFRTGPLEPAPRGKDRPRGPEGIRQRGRGYPRQRPELRRQRPGPAGTAPGDVGAGWGLGRPTEGALEGKPY